MACDYHPGPYRPFGDESVPDVGIAVCKIMSCLWGITPEYQHGPVSRFGQCSGHEEATVIAELVHQTEVLIAERSPALNVVLHSLVKQDVKHTEVICLY